MELLQIFWNLVIESAPWLLIGYFLAGVIKQLIPSSWVERQLAKPGFGSIVKGALIGAPLPLCSCGVIPTALAIRKAGASKGATSSFLVATPETGVDSIAFSWSVLGPIFAMMRPIGALSSAIVAGVLVNRFDADGAAGENIGESEGKVGDTVVRMAMGQTESKTGCCAAQNAAPETEQASTLKQETEQAGASQPETLPESANKACNTNSEFPGSPATSSPTAAPADLRSLAVRLADAVKYGYGRMISDTAKWLVIGLVAATLITAAVPQEFFLQWGDGLMAMLVMVIAGLPMYICATASTPVAAGLLFAGISPGAALVFMLTGPATNIATMGVIREQLGNKSLVAYLVGVIGTAIACGLLLNAMYTSFGWPLQLAMAEHGEAYPLWRQMAAVLLAGLVLRVWIQPLLSAGKSSATPAMSSGSPE